MIQGFFIGTPPHVPIIQITIIWNDLVLQPIFVLDTGFSGDIKISPSLANELGLEPYGYEMVTTADNSSISRPVAIGKASLEGVQMPVEVLIGNGSHLAGIGLLKKFGYRAIFDPKKNSVFMEKVT